MGLAQSYCKERHDNSQSTARLNTRSARYFDRKSVEVGCQNNFKVHPRGAVASFFGNFLRPARYRKKHKRPEFQISLTQGWRNPKVGRCLISKPTPPSLPELGLLKFRDVGDVSHPWKPPADPNLSSWRAECGALIESPNPEGIVWIVVGRQSKHRTAADTAERMTPT
jgi:hypothetical protein